MHMHAHAWMHTITLSLPLTHLASISQDMGTWSHTCMHAHACMRMHIHTYPSRRTGDVVTGAEALRLGLVASSTPTKEEATGEALAIARRIAAQSPLAVRAVTRTLRVAGDQGLERALQREADAQAQSYASADYAEGLAAIRAKRTPEFPNA